MNDLPLAAMQHVVAGKLDPNTLPDTGAPVEMAVSAIHAGETLTLFLALATGEVIFTQPLPIGSSGRPIVLRIGKQYFTDLSGRDVKVYYTVSPNLTSPELAFQIDQGFAGAHELDLTMFNFMPVYRNGEIRLPEQLPAFLSFSRPSPGATGYSSSDPSVATVDAQGMVTALRNGQCMIAATQADGGQQQYQLTVKGIGGLEILSTNAVTWQNANSLCASMGMQLPTQVDFSRIDAAYGVQMASLQLPDYPIWGATLGGGTAWTYHPFTRVITSESTDAFTLRQVAGIG